MAPTKTDGYFAIELGGAFCEFDMEGDEMSRASELIHEIENQMAAFRKRLWGGISPEAQVRLDKLEAENLALRQSLNELGRELVRIAAKGRD